MMNTTTLKTLLVCAMLGLASMTNASTFSEVEKTCPVGGERFRYMAHNSYTTFGQMPDGMPIGTSLFPILPPICPGNGMIMFRDFSEDEVARLASFIATDDFTAMRQSETPMYIAARMAALLDGHDSPWMLLSATWEAKRDPIDSARAMRYQQSFIAAASNASMPESLERVILLGRTANAQRELGDFEAAGQTLVAASSMLERLPSPLSTGDYNDDDEDSRQAVRRYLQSLNAPIVRGDAARQPLDMADRMSAARRCLELGVQSRPEALASYEREVCQSEAVAEAITAMQRIRRR